MRKKHWMIVLALVIAALAVASCSPAPTPTPVPTAVPTKAPPPTAIPLPTTAAPATPATAPTAAPTAAPTTALATPTKVAGEASLPPTKATPVLSTGTPKSADDMLEVTPQQLKAMIDGGADIVIVDAQPAEAFVLGHIPGAVNLPWDMKIKSAGGLTQSKLLVLYCGCSPDAAPSETDAGDVAMQLYTTYGYRKLATLKGGWDTWQQLGYPVAKGK